jgi:hypothetical protein
MKINEITSGYLKTYVGIVRCVVSGMGTLTVRVAIECDTLTGARYALARYYGRENVLSVQQITNEAILSDAKTFGAENKALTPQQLQVKALKDQSKQLKNRAKQVKAQQSVQKAQKKLIKANQTVSADQFSL